MTVRIAGYARASTDKQQLSPEIQEDMIKSWYEHQVKMGRWPQGSTFIGMFIDAAVSTRVDMMHREAGQHVLTTLGEGDVLVVAKYNRAFRSAADCERTLKIANEAGINFVFLDLNIDTATPNGQLIIGILAVVSKHERDLRSITTKEAHQLRRKKGLPVGRPPLGWKIHMGRLAIWKEKRMMCLAARRLFRQGFSRLKVYHALRKHFKRHGLPRIKGEQRLVEYAAAACLDFPRHPLKLVETLLGYKVTTIKFIRFGDHDAAKVLLRQRLDEKGYP